MPGTLYLIPVPLGEHSPPASVLAPDTLNQLQRLKTFVVEHEKTARHFLKAASHPLPIQQIRLMPLNEHTAANDVAALLQPLLAGEDIGLMSEAGCPGVADPGAALVALAHDRGITVRPLVGPSSLLLALMASGLNGQSFAFSGYLPVEAASREQKIRQLEQRSASGNETQLLIETPYRNAQLFAALLQACRPDTRITVATDVSLPSESIVTRSVEKWRTVPLPDFDKRPTVFLLLAVAARNGSGQHGKADNRVKPNHFGGASRPRRKP